LVTASLSKSRKKGKKEDINFNQKTPRTSTIKRTSFLDDLLQL
jgi:hypothetical protein